MHNIQEVNTINIASVDIYKDIFIKPQERMNFLDNMGSVTLPVYFYRIIGIEQNSKDEYYNAIHNLDQQLKKLDKLYNRIDFRPDTNVGANIIQKVNAIWEEIKADSNLRAPYISANFYGSGILKLTKKERKDILVRNSFHGCLESFISMQKPHKTPGIIKNFCIKLLYWFEKYALQALDSYDFQGHNPKMLFYGDIKRDEIFFLIFLSRLGFDILYFNPFSDCGFDEIDPGHKYSTRLEFNEKCLVEPFPKAERVVTVETFAFQAERSMETIMVENYNFIKPWQFENYEVKSVTLKTTYEEMLTLWGTEAKSRAGFRVVSNTVYIPNIFAKINGTDAKLQVYWTNMLKLLKEKSEFAIFIDKMPFAKQAVKSFDYRILVNTNGLFDKEKVKNCSDYTLAYLKASIQDMILEKANELIQKDFFTFNMDVNIKTKVLATLLNLDKEILRMLHKFDYPFTAPKVLIYHNTASTFSAEDYITIAFLDSVGFDIAIFTPAGYSSIENGIKRNLFDVHKLEEIVFDLGLSGEIRREVKRRQAGSQEGLFDRLKTWLK